VSRKNWTSDNRFETAQNYAAYQEENARGGLAFSSSRFIAIMTPIDEMRLRLAAILQPHLEQYDCDIRLNPTVNEAINSLIVLFDVEPKADSRMHADYDRVLRMKKSMKKFGHDFLGVIGPRDKVSAYARGTYGTLHFFCFENENPEFRDPELTADGLPTVHGPILYNFADLPQVILKFVLAKK
jgi:hypothetical protein